MGIKQVRICDGCGKEFISGEHPYHLVLETDRFFDGTENDSIIKSLDFCSVCASDIKNALIKISRGGYK